MYLGLGGDPFLVECSLVDPYVILRDLENVPVTEHGIFAHQLMCWLTQEYRTCPGGLFLSKKKHTPPGKEKGVLLGVNH
jgi:hypothetical protein